MTIEDIELELSKKLAEFLEKEILPKTSEEDAKNVKDKIRELRIDADDFHTWSWL